jgi:hypothetical protein
MLPDELEHKEFVEVGIEQGPRDGVQFPVVVVRPLGEVDDHLIGSRFRFRAVWFSPLSRVLSSATVRGKATWLPPGCFLNVGWLTLERETLYHRNSA